MSALHDLRNKLGAAVLAADGLNDLDESQAEDVEIVREALRGAVDLLPALALDLAAVEGLRVRIADLEQRLAATEAALDEERAKKWTTDDEADEDEAPTADSEADVCEHCGGYGATATHSSNDPRSEERPCWRCSATGRKSGVIYCRGNCGDVVIAGAASPWCTECRSTP